MNIIFLFNLISILIYLRNCCADNYTSPNKFNNTNKNNLNTQSNPLNDNLKQTNLQLLSPLIRIKREPPCFTVIKHRSRYIKQRQKPRRRIKSQKIPKVKYGPPNYSFGEPLTFYKPHVFDVYETTKSTNSHKNFENDFHGFEDTFGSNYNLEKYTGSSSADNNKPISFEFDDNYDKGNKEPTYNIEQDEQYYWENLTENPKTSYDTEQEYQFETAYPQRETKTKRPKQNYNNRPSAEIFQVPDFTTSQDHNYETSIEYQKPANIEYEPFSKYNFNSESNNQNKHGSQNRYLPPEEPKTQYIPPEQSQNNYLPPERPKEVFRPSERSTETYEKPERQTEQYEPTLNDNQDDNYSNSFQDLPSITKNENRIYKGTNGQFAEPPESEVEVTHATTIKVNPVVYSNDFKPPYSGPKYLPPLIKTSDIKTKTVQENTPGPYAEPPPISQGPNYYSSYNPPNHSNLPLNDGKRPSYDFPKTSYEVPIYSSPPIIQSENNHHEYYPPINGGLFNEKDTTITKGSNNVEVSVPSGKFKNQHPINTHTLSVSLEELDEPPTSYLDNILGTTSTTTARTRKRKRIKSSTPKQHNLDTDELRKAFGSTASQLHNTNLRSKRRPPNIPNFILDASTSKAPASGEVSSEYWEPIKVRNNLDLGYLNLTKPAVRIQRTSEKKFQDIEVISIEKSLSHSFYDGTMSPIEMTQKYPGLNVHSDDKISKLLMNPKNFNKNNYNYERDYDELPINHKYN